MEQLYIEKSFTPLQKFKNFDEAADTILRMVAKLVDINTLFIAKNDTYTNEIVKVYNKQETLLNVGDTLPFNETFCKLSVDHGRQVLLIADITQNEMTKNLNVTKNLGSGSFVGIPIYQDNGKNYGTICGLDTKPYHFTEQHVELFETMSSLLGYVLDLDDANKQIDNLSVPLVPITKGVAVLPIIGSINETRLERIIDFTLFKSQELSLDYMVIDLSGITLVDDMVVGSLLRVTNMLKLLGVHPILTGIRPETAIQANQSNISIQDLDVHANLESALNKIGFHLEKKK